MFDTLPETCGRGAFLGPGSVSTALFAHGALILTLLFLTLLPRIEPGEDPILPHGETIVIVTESPRLGNDPLGGGRSHTERHPKSAASERDLASVQPHVVPEIAPPPAIPPASEPPEDKERLPVDASEPATEGAAPDGNGTGPGSGEGPGEGEEGVPWGKRNGRGTGPGGEEFDPNVPLIIDGSIEEPVPLLRVQPEYPEMARRAHIEGVVVLQAVIGTDGRVESVRSLASVPLLEEAAVKAVRQWRYLPARQRGHPVKVYYTIRVEFTLR